MQAQYWCMPYTLISYISNYMEDLCPYHMYIICMDCVSVCGYICIYIYI